MSVRAVSFALDAEQARKLVGLRADDRHDYLEEIEEAWDEDWAFEHDKAWDALHRCLGDGTLESPEPTPLVLQAVLGGDELTPDDEEERLIRFVPAARVGGVAKALSSVTPTSFRKRFDALGDTDYDGPANDDDFEYTWESLVGLRAFFARAAKARRAVVFTL
jgi:hypothetical protein